MTPGRTVTLVLVDQAGEVLGQLPPFAVPTPWWQDVELIGAARPGVVVLRLLHVEPDPVGPMGGRVTYLAECADRPADLVGYDGDALDDHPMRLPWARPRGPAAALRWAAEHVRVEGDPVQIRTWNLSSIWRIPTTDGDCWLKCVPPFLGHEAVVVDALSPSPSVPRIIAADDGRILFATLPGGDGYGAGPIEHRAIIETLVELLQRGRGLCGAVPDWTAGALRDGLLGLAERSEDRRPGLDALLDAWDERWAKIEDCGIGDGLFHGDAHPGNARIGVRPPVVFDWGDSGWGHPLLDLAVVDDVPDRAAAQDLRQHWLEQWRQALPHSDPERAWALLEPVAVARCALVFQRFLDAIEPSEHVYHRDDVAPYLTAASRLVESGR